MAATAAAASAGRTQREAAAGAVQVQATGTSAPGRGNGERVLTRREGEEMAPTTEPPQPPQPQHPLHDEGDGSDNRRTPATETQQTSNSPDIPVGRASGGGFDPLDGPSVGEMLTGSKPPSALKHQTTTSPEPGGSEVGNFSETLLQNSNPATVASASLRHQSSLVRDRKGGGRGQWVRRQWGQRRGTRGQ